MELIDLEWLPFKPEPEEDETCGVVLKDLTIIELPNRSSYPHDAFVITEEDMAPYLGDVLATWHTHPRGPGNLSIDDYNTFMDLSEIHHLIITPKSVSCYKTEDSWVLNIGRRLF